MLLIIYLYLALGSLLAWGVIDELKEMDDINMDEDSLMIFVFLTVLVAWLPLIIYKFMISLDK